MILVVELGADPLQIADFTQRAAGGRHDRFAGRRERRQPLALADEHLHAKLVLELANLFADARLRGVQCLGGVGHVEPVIDDRAEIAQLLQVHAFALMPFT